MLGKVVIATSFASVGCLLASAAMAQADPTRAGFAVDHCRGRLWIIREYDSYQSCYNDYYNNYPNDPRPISE